MEGEKSTSKQNRTAAFPRPGSGRPGVGDQAWGENKTRRAAGVLSGEADPRGSGRGDGPPSPGGRAGTVPHMTQL